MMNSICIVCSTEVHIPPAGLTLPHFRLPCLWKTLYYMECTQDSQLSGETWNFFFLFLFYLHIIKETSIWKPASKQIKLNKFDWSKGEYDSVLCTMNWLDVCKQHTIWDENWSRLIMVEFENLWEKNLGILFSY